MRQREEIIEAFEELAGAIKSNRTATAREILQGHPELASRMNDPLPGGPFGALPIHAAVHLGNREMVDLLLAHGADIDAKTRWWAGGFGVLDGDSPLVPYLIERGTTVDAYAAARHGMIEHLAELVAADQCAVHARGGDGQTPLHVAHSVEVARYLIDHGADIDARDVDHESTAAQYLVRDRPDVARYLVSRGCATDVLMAAALGDLALVRGHLDADPSCLRMSVSERWFPKKDPRAGGTIYIWTLGWNKTPHVLARESGHESTYRLLLDRSPDELKLALACELGEDDLARELLARNPNLPATLPEDDRRRLVDAAQNDDTAAVRRMLEAGWPVDARGQHGGTALHWAAFHGNAEMVRGILRHAPSLETKDADHQAPPLGWALHGSLHGWNCRTGDYSAAVEALLRAGALPPQGDVEASEPVLEVLRRHA